MIRKPQRSRAEQDALDVLIGAGLIASGWLAFGLLVAIDITRWVLS